MHVVVIEAKGNDMRSIDLGDLSGPIGSRVQYASDGFTKYAHVVQVVTDPIEGRKVAIAFGRGTVAQR